jgi:pyrimidine operon attenuation protein/uracil phosphoribosyltransferase
MAGPPGYRERLELLSGAQLRRTLTRISAEILERHPGLEGVVLVGVRTRGVPLARRIATLAREASGVAAPVGALDITLYRDDLTTIAPHPVLKGTDIPVSIDGKTVILVDDVLYTGRTVRAALDELIDFGRPARIELAVVVDRGHRELPIRADYVGAEVKTAPGETVQVTLAEEDGEDRVALLERHEGPAVRGARSRRSRLAPARAAARSAGRKAKR